MVVWCCCGGTLYRSGSVVMVSVAARRGVVLRWLVVVLALRWCSGGGVGNIVDAEVVMFIFGHILS